MDRTPFEEEHEEERPGASESGGAAEGPPTWAVEGPDPDEAPGDSGTGAREAAEEGSEGDAAGKAGAKTAGKAGGRAEGIAEASECLAFGAAMTRACAAQAGVLDAAVDLVIEVRDRVLERKDLVGVELGRTAARGVLADVKRCAVTEIQLKAGYGVTEARTLVALALAAGRLRQVLMDSMRRGESSWPLVRHFWETSAQLTDDQRFLVATALFGLDEGLAVPERLDPDGRLMADTAWSHDSFTAACDREVAACEGIDVMAERERRRRAYAARAASLRLNDDGTGTLSVRGPITSLAAVYQRIDKGARNARALGDERTLANLRCDLISALLLYGTVEALAGSAPGRHSDAPAGAGGQEDVEGEDQGRGNQGPVDQTSGDQSPVDQTSGDQRPDDQSPGNQNPVDQSSSSPSSSNQGSGTQSPFDQSPVNEPLIPDHDTDCAARGAADAEAGPCDCGAASTLDDVIAPEQMDLLVRVINALPPVALQVVVPLDMLTPVINRCPSCGEDGVKKSSAGEDASGGPAAQAREHPQGGSSAPSQGDPRPDDPGADDLGANDRGTDDLGADDLGADDRGIDDPGEDSVPEWMRILATWLPVGAGRGLVGEVLGPKPFFLAPGHARELALTPGATIHRLITDPADGRCIERTRKGYRPDADMRRQIQAADVYSRRPGSRTHAAACELDHVTPWGWAGGPTSEPNLATLELPTHRSKTDGYLDLTINHRRDLTFTTLLGQVVRTRVHAYGQYLRQAAPDDLATRRDLANRVVYAAYAANPGRGEAPPGLSRPGGHESWITLTHTALGRRRPGPAQDTPTVSELLDLPVDDDAA